MIIKKDINLQYLALQVVKTCPRNASKQFKDGFIDFIKSYFEELESFVRILWLGAEHGADIDLNLALESTFKYLEQNKEINLIDYWEGVALANEVSEQILNLAFEFKPMDQAA